MTDYKIFAGLNGTFGGPTYRGTFACDNMIDAVNLARQMAVEVYKLYEGRFGLPTFEDCRSDIRSDYPHEAWNEADIQEYYETEVNNWIEYYAMCAM